MGWCIIENDDGMTIVEQPEGMTSETLAELEGGVLIDAGPFDSYDHAYDALMSLETLEDEPNRSAG